MVEYQGFMREYDNLEKAVSSLDKDGRSLVGYDSF